MIGMRIAERYLITEQVGSGGMAIIYAAVDTKTKRKVALKILREEYASQTDSVERFIREAQTVSVLNHPNIVRVYNVGCDKGIYYIAMEFVEGETVKDWIRLQGPLGKSRAISIALDVLSALECAHDHNIIHRDIKPHNILVTPKGQVKITDFGIAKSLDSKIVESEQNVFGSVYYISPEQAKGEEIDEKTDIYSLGITLYEMLTGVLPYTGDTTVSIALQHISGEMVQPSRINPNISESLSNIVLKATAKDKNLRYSTPAEMARDLIKAKTKQDGSFVDVPKKQTNEAAKTSESAKSMVALICAAVALFTVVAVLLIVFSLTGSMKSNMVKLPDLVGMDIDEAQQALDELNVKYDITKVADSSIAENTVISQEPSANTVMNINTIVRLTVSSGPERIKAPDLAGKTLRQTLEILQQHKLSVGSIEHEYDSKYANGVVIGQRPAADEPVPVGGSIDIIINTTEAELLLPVPDVKGANLIDAVAQIKSSGFLYCAVKENPTSTVKDGTITAQSPRAGSNSDSNKLVVLETGLIREKPYSFEVELSLHMEKGEVCTITVSENGIEYFVYEEGPAPKNGETKIRLTTLCGASGALDLTIYSNGRLKSILKVNAE